MNYEIGQKVWVTLNAPECFGIACIGTVVGFTPKRIKCEVNGFIANYASTNVEPKELAHV